MEAETARKTLVDDDRRKAVIMTSQSRFSKQDIDRMKKQWQEVFKGWARRPRLIIADGIEVHIINEPDGDRDA